MKPLFAIRHKPTGSYLPKPKGHSGRGGSHLEPVDCSGDINPRLFHSRISARNALSAWLRGKFHAERYWESNDEYGSSGYYVDDLPSVEPQAHRKKEDMEIVELHLKLQETAHGSV